MTQSLGLKGGLADGHMANTSVLLSSAPDLYLFTLYISAYYY